MKYFAFYVFLTLLSDESLASGLDKSTADAIKDMCQPLLAEPPREMAWSAGVNTLYRLLGRADIQYKSKTGGTVPESLQATALSEYRNCVLGTLNGNETVNPEVLKKPESPGVLVVDVLGDSQVTKQHEERLMLTLDGRKYPLTVNENRPKTEIMALINADQYSHTYLVEGFSVETLKKLGKTSKKRIFCQGTILLNNGDTLQLERDNESMDGIKVCLKKFS